MESKAEAWRKLIVDLDHDIFGQGYRLVTIKIKRRTQLDDTSQLKIARGLLVVDNNKGFVITRKKSLRFIPFFKMNYYNWYRSTVLICQECSFRARTLVYVDGLTSPIPRVP